MMKRLRALIVAAVITFAWSGTALAGNWAVTVIEDAPIELEAGAEHQITYTILQHGRTPADIRGTSLDFFHPNLKQMLSFPGEPTGNPGEYVVTVTLPAAGSWGWEVNQGWFGVQELGSIDVLEATNPSVAAGWGDISRYVLLLGTVLAAVLFGTQLRQRRREELVSSQGVV